MDIIEKMYGAITWMLHLPFTWFLDDETTQQQPEQQPETERCIRIIQHGKEKAWLRLTCGYCGCVFEARDYRRERVECHDEHGRPEMRTFAFSYCPECHAAVTEELIEEEK